MKNVLGLGNALVDLLIKLSDDKLIETLGYPKGSMQLIDAATADSIEKKISAYRITKASGGSAANTIHGLAMLGAKCGYIGKIGNDELGSFYQKDLENAGIEALLQSSETETGRANTFISADSERTFATYLGAAVELSANDLSEEVFKGYEYIHIEGYLVQNYELIETALKMAKNAGLKVSLDLASFNVVEDSLEFLQKVIPQYVDIVFANEEEAKAYTGKSPEESLHEIAKQVDIAVVKIGKDGSMIKSGDEVVNVGIIECKPVDTTGAGDNYASGFIYGLTKGYNFEKCGKIGALLAGTVIEKYGARIQDADWPAVKAKVKEIIG